MTHLETIRAACIKANPEIAELKEGCTLNMELGESYGWLTVMRLNSICRKHKKYHEECAAEENGCHIDDGVWGVSGTEEEWWVREFKISDIRPEQIIGRNIRLADVLLAISSPEVIITSHKGEFRYRGDEAAYWNLLDDNLDHQSEETLAFIANLL